MANLASPSSKTELAVYLLAQASTSQPRTNSRSKSTEALHPVVNDEDEESEESDEGGFGFPFEETDMYRRVAASLNVPGFRKRRSAVYPSSNQSSDSYEGGAGGQGQRLCGDSRGGGDGCGSSGGGRDEGQREGLPLVLVLHATARIALSAARGIVMLPLPGVIVYPEVTKLRVS